MIVKQTTNIEEIKSILFHNDILELNEQINIDKDDFNFHTDKIYYVGGYDKEKIVALACFNQFRDGLRFHPNVLKSYRQRYGREFVRYTATMLKCIIYIEIPEKRRDLFNLARKLGFDSLANNKDSTGNHKILMRLE